VIVARRNDVKAYLTPSSCTQTTTGAIPNVDPSELAGRLVPPDQSSLRFISMSYFKTLFWALAFAATTIGVTVEHSLDDQLPLVARVDSPYDWTFSAQTFGSCDNISQYTISSLPIWLQFDAALRRFHGTPSLKDVGAPEITVTAHGCNATAHSWFNILVTTEKPPVLHLPIAQQFNTSNPSLSSVFIVGPDSLRVPPKWSFSIGFEGKTFFSESKLFYDVLQSDGSGLPKWMKFDQSGITLDGYSPSEENTLYHLALHVSDQHGYTASTIPFTLIISSHDLSIPYPMPTVNVTSNNAFSFIFDSPTDFSGILVDGQPIQPGNISSLSIDTTAASDWLSYDEKTRTLTGTTSEDGENAFLPVKIQTDSNRTIDTNVTIAPVPSYFTYDPLPAFLLGSDRMVEVPIGQYFANNSGDTQATLSATFDPLESANFLTFDSSAARVTGLVPESFPGTFIAVNITAYTNTTHSTSHTSLPIALTSDELMKHPTGPPDSQASGRKPNKKLIMGLGIAFGVVGGICALLCLLALTRRLARAKDTAGKDEEAQKVLSEKDRMWYGLESGRSSTEGGYGKKGAGIASPVASITAPKTPANTVRYGNVGIRPVAAQTTGGSTQMSKREFVSRLRDTVRKVSDQYKRRKPLILNKTPMTIGNPSLIHRTSESSSIPVPTGPNPTPIQSKGMSIAAHCQSDLTVL